MSAPRRCWVGDDTLLQVGLALLGLVLSALTWVALLAIFAAGG